MVMLVRVLGVVIVIMGVIFGLNPGLFQQYVKFWRSRRKLIAGGILSFLFGVIFLLSASKCRLPVVIIVIGIWSLIKGVLLFILNEKKLNAYCEWWLKRPLLIIRFLGFIVLAFGGLILYSA